MAEAPQTPDLHTIFGMDEKPASGEPTVQIEHEVVLGDDAADGAGALEDDALAESFDDDAASAGVALGDRSTSPSKPGAGGASDGQWKGITRASRRGSRSRFLTDVIVELGFATDEQVKDAIEASRSTGTTPEKVLISSHAITSDQLARALAERYGLDHLDLSVFQVDMSAANCITTSAARRYQAVPVAFVDDRTLLVAMADPANVLAVDDIAIMTGR
jgi:hypothetical protein